MPTLNWTNSVAATRARIAVFTQTPYTLNVRD